MNDWIFFNLAFFSAQKAVIPTCHVIVLNNMSDHAALVNRFANPT